MTQQQLIYNCQKGDKASQYELVKHYGGWLLGICRLYTRDESMAKDVTQETLIRIFKNIDKYEERGSFEGWMRQIAVRRSLQWIEKSCFQHEAQPEQLPELQKDIPDAYSKMETDEILYHLNGLPEGYRAVFTLRIVEGYEIKEIADMLTIKESTVRSQLTRARVMLQQSILKKDLTSLPDLGHLRNVK